MWGAFIFLGFCLHFLLLFMKTILCKKISYIYQKNRIFLLLIVYSSTIISTILIAIPPERIDL